MVDKSKNTKTSSSYDASKITVLEGLAPVRKRPGMYIGGTGADGLHHLVWEVLDNAIDEAMAGFCHEILVTLHGDGSVSVDDDGRGIPVDKMKSGKSALETVLTVLHAGGKFGDGGYKVSGGLHGVGVSVVNALSVSVKAYVKRDGKLYFQEFQRGDAVADVKNIEPAEGTGTKIVFLPDPEIFTSTTEFSFQTILNRCRQQAYLTKGVMITVVDEREDKKVSVKVAKTSDDDEEKDETLEEEVRTGRAGSDEDEDVVEHKGKQKYSFYFEGGISSYVLHLNKNKTVLNSPPMYVEKEVNNVMVEISLAYTDDFKEHIYTFANNINTPEGGTHLTGFKAALTRALNDYAKKNNYTKDVFSGEDVREGITAVLSVKLPDPQFEGQTKAKLGNTEVRTIVESVTAEGLAIYLDEHPSEAKKIAEKCLLSTKARLAARAARDTIIRKGALEGMTLPGKLADCSSKDASKTELYIVEGDSAGGSAKQGRDRNFQAILPLRGKILNVERARLDRMLSSDEIKALIIAMGVGIGDEINYDKLRYDRVIIMTDADVDGAHIRTLLLTFLYRNFPDLISHGHIYIAQPPLFSVTKGKNKRWVYTEAERDQAVKELMNKSGKSRVPSTEEIQETKNEEDSLDAAEEFDADDTEAEVKTTGARPSIQRFKGLGEMSAEQLWETTMNPENRVLLQVTLEDVEKTDAVFTMLMGDQVPPRKKFIQTRAKTVQNLDA
ncbi:DNA topoisomerase (ATP-hydrolyzing) subunit B [Candidatus Berkelbacteria bacterium CG10_big_fil_rev_8_21_14_0_10_43_13]|uniref:DNA gyrase subunit B n=1 Tax=Candidatus Berkelbacteria bacterium CG10_big_fil_rev_8_21_14_0_10_43_13 TaxID=1974514 RepID=A0A2H0W9M3_9BACT|nr:MAG: DNA topoisomerase (ATP-hydrolyzing) subunit B [Candidatus Berkelbacteria bacterium CG10_big_fil_rev_8_21_14_0_10_43_13]